MKCEEKIKRDVISVDDDSDFKYAIVWSNTTCSYYVVCIAKATKYDTSIDSKL